MCDIEHELALSAVHKMLTGGKIKFRIKKVTLSASSREIINTILLSDVA